MESTTATRSLHVVLVASAIGAIIAGCGGNGTAATEDTPAFTPEASTTMTIAEPPITKAQFIERVNGICRQAWPAVQRLWARDTRSQDMTKSKAKRFEEAVRFPLLAGIDIYIFDKVREIGAPPEDEMELEEIVGPFQVAVELGWKERWRANSVAEVASHFATYNRRAQEYGLDDCVVNERHLRLRSLPG